LKGLIGFRFVIFVAGLILVSDLACASESFACQGDLKVYGYDGKRTFLVSAGTKDFIFSRSQLLALAFAADRNAPALKVFPWNGIHWADISKQVSGVKFAMPLVQTDGEHWFSVSIVNHTGDRHATYCSQIED